MRRAVPVGKCADSRVGSEEIPRFKKGVGESCNKRARIDEQSARLAVNRAWHCQRSARFATQRDSSEFFRRSHSGKVHVTRLIDFEENKSRSAIDHRLVTGQNFLSKNAIDVSRSR